MKMVLSSVCVLVASVSAAQGFPAFGNISFSQLRETKTNIATPRAKAGDVISAYHMIAQAGKSVVFGYADNAADAAEAVNYWSGVLKTAGIQPGAATFADGMYQIPYTTADGRVLRDFLADARQFPPKDEAGLRDNMALTSAALNKAGLNVVATHVVNVDALLPTYSILYLTQPNELPEREARARVLKPGEDIDVEVYKKAGVNVIQTPETWMMVYVGPAVGYVTLWADSAENLDAKIKAREDLFSGEGKKMIAVRREAIDDPTYKFGAALYFFQ
jgi:hypothetical protein